MWGKTPDLWPWLLYVALHVLWPVHPRAALSRGLSAVCKKCWLRSQPLIAGCLWNLELRCNVRENSSYLDEAGLALCPPAPTSLLVPLCLSVSSWCCSCFQCLCLCHPFILSLLRSFTMLLTSYTVSFSLPWYSYTLLCSALLYFLCLLSSPPLPFLPLTAPLPPSLTPCQTAASQLCLVTEKASWCVFV